MAVNPIQFLVASNASILDGTKTISISGNVDCSRVYSGTAVFLGGAYNPAEAVSGTSPDGSGVSTITLRNNWSQGDISNQPLVSFNTNEGLAEAISNVREIVSNVSAIEDLATQGLIKRIDDNNYEVVDITSLGESLVGANDASTARGVLGLGSAATRNIGTDIGNLMEVGAFGWGLTDDIENLPVDNLDDITNPTGMYRIDPDTLGTRPPNLNQYGTLILGRLNSLQPSQLYIDSGGNMATRFAISGGGWQNWLVYYHLNNTGDVVSRDVISNSTDTTTGKVLTNVADFNFFALRDYGGYYPSTAGVDIDDEPKGSKGLYATGNNGTFPVDPTGQIGFYNIKTEQIYTGDARHQHAIGYFGTNASNNVPLEAFRTLDNGGQSWTPWAIKLTDRNTNLNEFGGLATSVVAVGTARTNNEILFYLPINSYERPSGITVTSTFNLRGENNVAIGNEQLSLSGTFNATLSSERYAVLIVSGLTGITQGSVYRLQCHTNISRIKVNF